MAAHQPQQQQLYEECLVHFHKVTRTIETTNDDSNNTVVRSVLAAAALQMACTEPPSNESTSILWQETTRVIDTALSSLTLKDQTNNSKSDEPQETSFDCDEFFEAYPELVQEQARDKEEDELPVNDKTTKPGDDRLNGMIGDDQKQQAIRSFPVSASSSADSRPTSQAQCKQPPNGPTATNPYGRTAPTKPPTPFVYQNHTNPKSSRSNNASHRPSSGMDTSTWDEDGPSRHHTYPPANHNASSSSTSRDNHHHQQQQVNPFVTAREYATSRVAPPSTPNDNMDYQQQQSQHSPPPPNQVIIRDSLKRKFQPPTKKPAASQPNNHKRSLTLAAHKSKSTTTNKPSHHAGNDNDDDDLPPELQRYGKELVEKIEQEIMEGGGSTTKVTFDTIAGLHDQKQIVQEVVCWPMKRPDLFTGLRKAPSGLLLYGPPGTGKTLIGKAIAYESGACFFSISSSSLTSKWIGEGEKLVRTMFAVAAYRQPSVVFLDEIDSLLSQRKSDENEASRRIKTEFLVHLDGTNAIGNVLLIGATNRPQELDEAARRRFTKRLYIPLPTRDDREQLIRVLLQSNAHQLVDSDIVELSEKTAGFSGADLKSLCAEAALGPIRSLGGNFMKVEAADVPPISFKHFKQALRGTKPSVAPSDLVQYEEWDQMYGSKRSEQDNDEDDE